MLVISNSHFPVSTKRKDISKKLNLETEETFKLSNKKIIVQTIQRV